MIIDAHVHIGSWDHPDFLGRAATIEEALEALAAAGVTGAALMPTDRADNEGLLAGARAAIAGGLAGPLWLIPWVRPGTGDLDWARAHHEEIAGIKLHPSLSRIRVTDAGFADALAFADAGALVVVVHCGRWQEIASYRFAIEAAAAHPRARFLLAHAGGDTPPLATAAADLVAAEKLHNVWFDIAGLREHWVVERNVEVLGADRYLMGSDYSLAHPAMYVGAVRGMRLSEADRRRILGENALELFGAPLGAGRAGGMRP